MTEEQQAMIDLMNGPRGGVLAIPGRPMCFWVKGSESVHEVLLAPEESEALDTCGCPGWAYRRTCVHLTAATIYWQRHRPRLNDYMDDDELRRIFA